MPFKNTRVIPIGWSQHHRPVANGSMTARCEITRVTGPDPWPPTDDPPQRPIVWPTGDDLGRCRVQEIDAVKEPATIAQTAGVRSYLVTVPIDGLPQLKAGEQSDIVTITECDDDPLLVGRVLRITDIQHGSLMFERDLVCTDDLTANGPTT